MKILLIYPPSENEITTQVSRLISGESSLQPPLGLMYIASNLLKAGYDRVKIIDSQAEKLSYEDIENLIYNEQPDVVGMTSLTFNMVDVMLTAKIVRSVAPYAKIVLGGPHVNIYPEDTVRLPEVDYAIRNEGEHAFLKLISCLENDKLGNLSAVENLVWIDQNGNVKLNAIQTSANDYSTMPYPARHLVPVEKYFSIMTSNNPTTTLITAKGCPYRCVFCYRNDGQVKYRTPSSIANEMEEIKNMGIREVVFVDDTFYVNNKKAMAICDEIIKRKLDLPWAARARVNNITEEMLEKLKTAGCHRLHIGMEAGNNKILKNINKKITVEMAKKAFKLCCRYKMDTLAYFIIGNPGEGIKDVEDTVRLAAELNPTFAQFSRMTPFPATKLYETGLERGIITYDYWKEFAKNPTNSVQPQFWTEHFTQDELADLADYAIRKFYLRTSYVINSIMQLRNYSDLKRKAKSGLAMLRAKLPRKPFKLKMT